MLRDASRVHSPLWEIFSRSLVLLENEVDFSLMRIVYLYPVNARRTREKCSTARTAANIDGHGYQGSIRTPATFLSYSSQAANYFITLFYSLTWKLIDWDYSAARIFRHFVLNLKSRESLIAIMVWQLKNLFTSGKS